jgi:microcystin-dependent protein
LIGTTYGGDGVSNFALPNLQGRLPIHQGFNGSSYYTMGQMDGTEMVTLNASQFPAHNHTLTGTSVAGASNSPGGNVLANLANVYVNAAPGNAMASGTLTPVINGNQPHENRQPYLVLNWVIALYGVYPSQ